MFDFSGLVCVLVIFVGGSYHSYLIIRGEINPPLAAWITFSSGMSVSYWLYWQKEGASLLGNPGQFSATIEILIVTAVLAISLAKRGKLRVEFTKDQIVLLVLTAATLLIWGLSTVFGWGDEQQLAERTFIASQALMVGGYVGTFLRFLKLRENGDSLFAWSCILTSSIFALFPAWTNGDALSMINAFRAVIASALTLGFLFGLDAKNGRFTQSA